MVTTGTLAVYTGALKFDMANVVERCGAKYVLVVIVVVVGVVSDSVGVGTGFGGRSIWIVAVDVLGG